MALSVPEAVLIERQSPDAVAAFDLGVSLIAVTDAGVLVNLGDDGCGNTCTACTSDMA